MPETNPLESPTPTANSKVPSRRRNTSRGRRISSRAAAILLATTGLLTAVAIALAQEPAAPASDATDVSTGVYTEEQAAVGAEVFLANCSGCHGAELEGGFGPQLAPIGEHWHGSSLGALYAFVSSAMPFSAPGSLEPQQYADVLAFVLQQNGYPAGEEPLAPDEEALEAFVLDVPQAATTPEY